MANNILITPSLATIQFSGSAGGTISLTVDASGSIIFQGVNGSLFTISDNLEGTLMSVSDISGLPIFEVSSDDKIIMGTFASNALVVTGSLVGIGMFPGGSYALEISGSVSASSYIGSGASLTGVTAAAVTWGNVTSKPTVVSASAQVDHDTTANFASNEHYTQASITTLGTVTSGNVNAILPLGTISGSTQLPAGMVSGSIQVSHDSTSGFVSGEHFLQSAITTVGTVTAGSVKPITLGYVSASAQVDHDSTTNFTSNEHFTQASITTLGTVTSGNVSAITLGYVTGSAQITHDSTSGFVSGEHFLQSAITQVGTVTAGNVKAITKTYISASAQVDHDTTTNFASNEHYTQASITTLGTVTAGSVAAITKTYVSASAQIDHDTTTNFASNEHYTQGAITTVGTVTSGNVNAILPLGTISGSTQLPAGTVSGSGQVIHDSTSGFVSGEHFLQSAITQVGTVTAGSVKPITLGYVSASAQIDHDTTTNFASNEHYTQASITTLGTVTAGSVTAILPSGTVSGSTSLPDGSVSGSIQIDHDATTNFLVSEHYPSGSITEVGTLSSLDVSGIITALEFHTTFVSSSIIYQSGSTKFGDTIDDVHSRTGSMFISGALSIVDTLSVAGAITSATTSLVSGSAQIDHDTTTNFASNEHYTQASITTVGTVTAGSVKPITLGYVSGSAQIAIGSTTGDLALGTKTSGNYVATITGGTGVDSTGATTGEGIAHTLSLDLNELTTGGTPIAGDGFVFVDGTASRKIAISSVPLSIFNNNSGWTTNTGTVTSVATGTGLTGGTITGTGTISHNDTSTLSGAYGSVGVSSVTVDALGHVTAVGTATYNNYSHPNHTGHVTSTGDGATLFRVAGITGQTALTSGLADADELLVSDGGVIKRMDITVLEAFMQSNLAFSNNAGTVTSVGVGTGLDVATATTTPNVTLDLGELAEKSGNLIGSDRMVVATAAGGSMYAETISAIPLSIFSNNSSWTSNTGTVTSVTFGAGALIDITGTNPVTTSGTATIAVDLSELTDMTTTNLVGTDEIVVLDAGVQKRKVINDIQLGLFVNDQSWSSTTGTVTSVGTTGTVNGITLTGTVTGAGNLTLGGTLGSITVSQLAGSAVQTSGEGFSDSDTILMTAAAIEDRITGKGYSTTTGTVTSVGGGTGIDSSGGTTPSISLNVSELGLGGTLIATDHLVAANGGVSNRQVISSIPLSIFNNNSGWTSNAGTVTSVGATAPVATSGGTTPTISMLSATSGRHGYMTSTFAGKLDGIATSANNYSHPTTAGNKHIPTAGSASQILQYSASGTAAWYTPPWTTNTGTVTAVTGGTGVDSTGGTTPSITLDVSELAVGGTLVAGDWLIASNATVSNKQLISNIPLSIFNNNSGWTTNTGTVTSVTFGAGALIDISGTNPVTTSGTATIAVDLSELTDMTTTNLVGTDELVVLDAGVQKRKVINDIQLGLFVNDQSWNNYSHPSEAGDDINIDTGALAGATVISDLDFNITTNTLGHVTDANAAISTRSITKSDIGLGNVANTAQVTSVGGGVGIDSSGGTTPSITLNLNELSTGGTPVAGDGFVFVDGTASRKIAISSVPLSIFNNNSGWTSNAGTVTSVGASLPIASSGGTTPSISIRAATSGQTGYMTTAYAGKLDGIASGATANGTVTGTGTTSGTNTGDNAGVTSVSGGAGVDSSGGTTPNITLDLNELTTSTLDSVGDFFVVVTDAGVQYKLDKPNINLSGFNNNSGWTSNTGTVTSVGTTGTVNGITLTGTVTGAGTLTLGGAVSINNSNWSGTDLSVANGGTGLGSVGTNYILTGNGTGALTAESGLTFDGTELTAPEFHGDGSNLTNLPAAGLGEAEVLLYAILF